MKKIKLTQGYEALVDDKDYEWINQCKWHVFPNNSGSMYAFASKQKFDGKKHHRLIMHRVINKTPAGFETDHINGNGLDNRRSNLRSVTRSQNMLNRKRNKKSSSKYKGVYWHKQHRKWIANIQINKKRIFIGLFKKELDAAKAYVSKVKELGLYINEKVYYG